MKAAILDSAQKTLVPHRLRYRRTRSAAGQAATQKIRWRVHSKRPLHALGILASLLGVFKSLPGVLASGSVILLFVHLRGSAVRTSGTLVQHIYRLSISPGLLWACLASV
jgi:hypothetical protein